MPSPAPAKYDKSPYLNCSDWFDWDAYLQSGGRLVSEGCEIFGILYVPGGLFVFIGITLCVMVFWVMGHGLVFSDGYDSWKNPDEEQVMRLWQTLHEVENELREQWASRGHSHETTHDNNHIFEISEVLAFMGLAHPPSAKALRQRYKLLAMQYHSDRRGGCEKKMKELNLAHALLKKHYSY
jgi:hypothetical protein